MFSPSLLIDIPASGDGRSDLLTQLIADWYDTPESACGYSSEELSAASARLGHPIPVALRHWYTSSGRRTDVWSEQDELLAPNQLRVTGDHLVFLVENQVIVQWGIPLNQLSNDDPPVHVCSVGTSFNWTIEAESVSMFALQRFVYCLKFSSSLRWFAVAHVNRSVSSMIADAYPELMRLKTWPVPMRYFGDRDTMIEIESISHDGLGWMYAVTRTSTAANAVKDVLRGFNIKWNSTSDEWPSGWVNTC